MYIWQIFTSLSFHIGSCKKDNFRVAAGIKHRLLEVTIIVIHLEKEVFVIKNTGNYKGKSWKIVRSCPTWWYIQVYKIGSHKKWPFFDKKLHTKQKMIHNSTKTYNILVKYKISESWWCTFVISAKNVKNFWGVAHADPFFASWAQK